MGMYTELVLGVRLKKGTPGDVINILKYMVEDERPDEGNVYPTIDHPLFGTDRWRWMLRSSSYYFAVHESRTTFWYDDNSGQWTLSARSSLKNYGDEIGHFLNWIAPYVDERGFAGYYQYEEDEQPTLIYFGEAPAQPPEGELFGLEKDGVHLTRLWRQ